MPRRGSTSCGRRASTPGIANKETIIQAYPDLFTTTSQAEVDMDPELLLDADNGMHDQCVTTVYLDEAWMGAGGGGRLRAS